MLKPTFVTTANGEPLTADRGLKFAVDFENAKLNVPNLSSTSNPLAAHSTFSSGTVISLNGLVPPLRLILPARPAHTIQTKQHCK